MTHGVITRLLAKPSIVWMLLILLTLVSAALAENNLALPEDSLSIGNISLLLVLAIVLVKGNLVIDHFMGLKHTRGWPQRIMKAYLALMLVLIGVCFVYF